jgi:two-component system sensor kinase FixL
VVREAAELALIGTRQHEVVTRFDLAAGLPEVMIDRVQLQQVIMNLVRNAVDALSEMERRELTIRTGADGQDAVRIDVIDRGPGLPDDIAKRLFQPFVTSKPGGIGIGLSICKTIVDAHDGELWTTENPEGGAIFHIRLPVRED